MCVAPEASEGPQLSGEAADVCFLLPVALAD
jgi:hypothetical protein